MQLDTGILWQPSVSKSKDLNAICYWDELTACNVCENVLSALGGFSDDFVLLTFQITII